MFQAEVLGLVAKSREFEAMQLRLQEKETRAAEAAARTEQLSTMLHAAELVSRPLSLSLSLSLSDIYLEQLSTMLHAPELVSLRALLVQNYLLY